MHAQAIVDQAIRQIREHRIVDQHVATTISIHLESMLGAIGMPKTGTKRPQPAPRQRTDGPRSLPDGPGAWRSAKTFGFAGPDIGQSERTCGFAGLDGR